MAYVVNNNSGAQAYAEESIRILDQGGRESFENSASDVEVDDSVTSFFHRLLRHRGGSTNSRCNKQRLFERISE